MHLQCSYVNAVANNDWETWCGWTFCNNLYRFVNVCLTIMSFLSGFRKSEISCASGACWRKINFHTGGLSVPKCFVVLCLFKPLNIVEHATPSHPHNMKRLVECLFVSIFPCRSLLYNTTLAASYFYQINTPVMFLKCFLYHHGLHF